MTPRSRRLAAEVAAVALVAAALVSLAPPGPQPAAFGAGQSPAVSVLLTTISPVAPSSTSTLTLAGTLVNQASSPISGLQIQLGMGSLIPDLETLDADMATPPEPSALVSGGTVSAPTTLPAGARAHFEIQVPIIDLPDVSPAFSGVYPLELLLSGTLGGVAQPVGDASTFLPYFPDQPSGAIQVLWLWPVAGTPPVNAAGELATSALPRSVAPGGRLARLVATPLPAAGGRALAPVTWVVDPALLQAVALLAHGGYRVAGQTTLRGPDPAAQALLASLRAQVRAPGAAVVSLPYADVDVDALARTPLVADIGNAVQKGVADTARLLGVDPDRSVTWPPGGAVTQSALDALAGAGISTLVLRGDALPVNPQAIQPPTPTALAVVKTESSSVRALVADTGLAQLLAAGPTGAPTARMAEQLFLAETAMITAEQPGGTPRLVVLSPPRGFDPDPAFLRSLLAATTEVPWMHPVTLGQALAESATSARLALTYPAADARAQLSGALLAHVAALRASLAELRGILPANQQITPALDDALFRAESAAWRTDPAGSRALQDGVAAQIQSVLERIQLSSSPTVTLASSSAMLPVTLSNGLTYPVTVGVRLSTTAQGVLRRSPVSLQTVPPGARVRVDIAARVERSGTFPAELSLTYPDGRPLHPPVQLVLRSTAYGALAVQITVGALAVLVLALLVRAVRRLRALRARAA